MPFLPILPQLVAVGDVPPEEGTNERSVTYLRCFELKGNAGMGRPPRPILTIGCQRSTPRLGWAQQAVIFPKLVSSVSFL